eukprot:INCI703.3.p1 GENE.INCI703.3~~INCI703.3.p1  ORF type:complete len:332 (+),score=52.73 INCI703.3:86-1081(+)
MFSSLVSKAGADRASVAFSLGFLAGKRHVAHSAIVRRCASQNPSWQQTMLRVKDPEASIAFYEKHFGFRLLDKFIFPQWKFGVYFLATARPDETLPEPGTEAAHDFLWNYRGCTLELTHNHGTEKQEGYVYHNSNDKIEVEGVPRGGFGHIAVNTPDVYEFCAKLEAEGVEFQKKPDEGRMKGLAFALDPDRYWVEIVKRSPAYKYDAEVKSNFSQTMLRIKDPTKSVAFYRDFFGMTVLRDVHLGVGTDWGFSLYFLATLSDEEKADFEANGKADPAEFVKTLHQPVLELTHNHGTEDTEGPSYHTGNTDPQGFGSFFLLTTLPHVQSLG